MHRFIGWTDIDREMSQEKLAAVINDLLLPLDKSCVLQVLAEISQFIFNDGYQNEIGLRNKYLSNKLSQSIQKFEQKSGNGFIFHKQASLI